MPSGMMYVRLVHLLDDQKRKELMIIYGEDLAPHRIHRRRPAERRQSLRSSGRPLQKTLLERARTEDQGRAARKTLANREATALETALFRLTTYVTYEAVPACPRLFETPEYLPL